MIFYCILVVVYGLLNYKNSLWHHECGHTAQIFISQFINWNISRPPLFHCYDNDSTRESVQKDVHLRVVLHNFHDWRRAWRWDLLSNLSLASCADPMNNSLTPFIPLSIPSLLHGTNWGALYYLYFVIQRQKERERVGHKERRGTKTTFSHLVFELTRECWVQSN